VSGNTWDSLDDYYKNTVDDSIFKGADFNFGTDNIKNDGLLDDDFTYTILKNKMGRDKANAARLLDITSENNSNSILNTSDKVIDNTLDDFTDSIFGY
jgi:hypothetical protein